MNILSIFMLIFSPVVLTTTIFIDPSTTYQRIEGWGVSLAWWANIAGAWPETIRKSITQQATQELNMNVFRFNVGGGENPQCPWGDHMDKDGRKMPGYRETAYNDQEGWGTYDLSSDIRQITVMDELAAARNDTITEIFSNSPPWWMTHSKCASGNTLGFENIKPEFIDDFADYLVTVAAALTRRNSQWNIKFIEAFNEPLSSWWSPGKSQEGSYFSVDTQAKVLSFLSISQKAYHIPDLERSAPDCNTVPETQHDIWALWKDHGEEYKGITKINTHSYSGTWQEKLSMHQDAKNGGKSLWQSESGPLNWSPPDGVSWWEGNYMMSYRQIEDLRNLQCTVWCDWQLISKDYLWGLLQWTNFDEKDPFKQPTLVKTKTFYCRKQINGFIKPNYQIIDTSDGVSIAAISPDHQELVLVLANQENTEKAYDFDLSSLKNIRKYRTFRTSGDENSQENCRELTKELVNQRGILTGGSQKVLAYVAPGFSVTTFVFDAEF